MWICENFLIISKKANNLKLLLKALADLEYKPTTRIDIIIKETYSDLEIKKLINSIIYLSQTNYSHHSFNIFVSDRTLLEALKTNSELQNTKRNIKINTLAYLINHNIIDNENKIVNINRYNTVLNIKPDRIEMFYDSQNIDLKV